MSELSKRFGMSQRWLAREFEREYEQSIYAFIVDRVLHEAHATIVQTSLPLKTLAQRVGYSNVNHFITAFKRKFGYTPGSLRS